MSVYVDEEHDKYIDVDNMMIAVHETERLSVTCCTNMAPHSKRDDNMREVNAFAELFSKVTLVFQPLKGPGINYTEEGPSEEMHLK